MLALGVAILACTAPADGASQPRERATTSAADPSPGSIDAAPGIVVESIDFAGEEFIEELRLRFPDRPVVPRSSGAMAAPAVYVRVAPQDPNTVAVTVVTGEGRAYDRMVATGDEPPVRVVASVVANLVFSIEAGTAAPDRTNVEIPQSVPDAAPPPAPSLPPPPTSAVAVDPAPVRAPRWALGVAPSLGAALGVAPRTSADVFAGGGGLVGLVARSPEGATVGLQARVLTYRRFDLTLIRVRVAVAGGYSFRWTNFALDTAAGLTIEPWFIRKDGGDAALFSGDAPVKRFPLLGGMLSIVPGYWTTLPGHERVALQVGPRFDVAGSFSVDDGARTVAIEVESGERGRQSAYRLGGLELFGGIEMTVWFELTRAR